MYSQVPFPPGVRNVKMKPGWRHTPESLTEGDMVADHRGDTWFVWERSTGRVHAVFHMAPNVHGWSASQAHARSYLGRFNPVHPFELDSVP